MILRISLIALLLFLPLDGLIQAQEKGKRRDIQVEGGVLSVALDQVPAKEVFEAIGQKGKIAILMDKSLFELPVTEEFDNVPLEEGLRRLIAQLQTGNFLISYLAGPGGERQVVKVEILAVGGATGGVELSSSPARDKPDDMEPLEIPKGIQKQITRGLNPAERKVYEQTGKLPRRLTDIPKGFQEKIERGEELAPGQRLRLERILRAQEFLLNPGKPEAPKDSELPAE